MIQPAETSEGVPIIQYWHSAEVPADVTALMATFTRQNPQLRHLVFDEAQAESLIARHLSSRELTAFRACAVPAMQADYLRYCAAFALGGICVDVDYRCVRSLRGLLEKTDDACLFRRSNGAVVNGFFVFKRPGHPLLRLVLDVATTNIERRLWEEVWWMTGPSIFTILWEMYQRDSVDELLVGAAERGVTQEVEQLLSTIGARSRVTTAFERVGLAEFDSSWIDVPETPPLYKQSDTHWLNWQQQGRTIYR